MKFKKILVANRSEIAIRVFRTAHELGLRTVAIYSHEDRFALHRFKADEAYMVGKAGEPIRSYLDIDSIVELARANGVDAIHPGYSFDDIRDSTGFDIGTATPAATPAPTEQELHTLRHAVRTKMIDTGTYAAWASRALAAHVAAVT